MRLLCLFLLRLFLLHQSCQFLLVSASAPGDEDTFCVTLGGSPVTTPPVHPPNSRILMDSYHYINLLPPHGGAVWQFVDNDTNNEAGRGTEVS